jgi:NitT/TauT family transport system substrate-binding protein
MSSLISPSDTKRCLANGLGACVPLLRYALVGLLIIAAAVGCAGEQGESDQGSMELNVGQISDSVGFFPLYVAEQEGFFEEEGLTLGERPRMGTGARLSAALTSGSIDIGAGVMTDALTLAESGRSSYLIGSLVNGYYIDVIVSDELSQATGLTEDSPIEAKVQALEGRNIGITGPGSGTEALVVYLLEQQGLNADRDVTLVNLGGEVPSALASMEEDRVDALSFFWPVGQAVETQGTGNVLIRPPLDVPSMSGQTHGVIFTTQEVLDAKPEAVQAFIRGIARAETLIREDPERAQELLGSYQEGLEQDTLEATFAALEPVVAEEPTIDRAGYETAMRFHEDSGLLTIEAPSYDDFVATDTIDESLSSSR